MSKKGETNDERSCQSISSVLKTDYLFLKTSYKDKSAFCENNSSGTNSPFLVTDCLGKFFTGIKAADSVSEKIT